jgi:hypothetical protein
MITKQPFPEIVAKGKQLGEDTLVIRLLTGSNTNFTSFGPIRATLITEMSAKAGKEKLLEHDVQQLDPQHRATSFPLKFLQGSRKSRVTLRFSMQVGVVNKSGQTVTAPIESPSTSPFIVITNESQWEQSEEILIKSDAFGGMLEVPWPQFCNTLHRHFLRATRQDPARPKRSLSQMDFAYLSDKYFNNKTQITMKEFEEFWQWFGRTLQVMRYQRHISSLWQHGYVFNFLPPNLNNHQLRALSFSMSYS